MHRMLEVSNAWNWLPAFRVVAEYQSIQKAALVLNVSASALSRTVRLLEEAVGEQLFVRGVSGLVLTHAGADLLAGTREAMRRIDDVFTQQRGGPGPHVFACSASGPILPRLLAMSLARIVGAHPHVTYRTLVVGDDDVVAELLRGNVDLAFVEAGPDVQDLSALTATPIGALEIALLAPPGVALGTADPTTPVITLAHHPVRRQGSVAAVVASIDDAERLAVAGPFLALLPVAVTSPGFEVVAAAPERVAVTALYRTPLDSTETPLGALVHALIGAARAVVARTDSNGPFA